MILIKRTLLTLLIGLNSFNAHADALTELEDNMITIPSGSFTMGSNNGSDWEIPTHTVSINSFKLGKYEVTQAQWQAVMGKNPAEFKNPNNPVENVSWDEVRTFIIKLNQKTGQHYRLPSEAEWEYAARAGSTTKYSWGNHIDSSLLNAKNYIGKTTPVGQYSANDFGLYDMHGNVSEWTQDCWNYSYNKAPGNGSAWLYGDCSERVKRGGSWYDNGKRVRSANRRSTQGGGRDNTLGFRLASDLKSPPSNRQNMQGDATAETLTPQAKLKRKENMLMGLALRFCRKWRQVRNAGDVTHAMVVDYIIENNLGGTTDMDVLRFYNENKEFLKCKKNTNFFKVAIYRNRYKSLFYRYIVKRFRKTDPQFDFNVVDIIDGKPETILDYIDATLRGERRQSRNPRYYKDLRKLRMILADKTRGFGAKTFDEFTDEEKAPYLLRAYQAAE